VSGGRNDTWRYTPLYSSGLWDISMPGGIPPPHLKDDLKSAQNHILVFNPFTAHHDGVIKLDVVIVQHQPNHVIGVPVHTDS